MDILLGRRFQQTMTEEKRSFRTHQQIFESLRIIIAQIMGIPITLEPLEIKVENDKECKNMSNMIFFIRFVVMITTRNLYKRNFMFDFYFHLCLSLLLFYAVHFNHDYSQ